MKQASLLALLSFLYTSCQHVTYNDTTLDFLVQIYVILIFSCTGEKSLDSRLQKIFNKSQNLCREKKSEFSQSTSCLYHNTRI